MTLPKASEKRWLAIVLALFTIDLLAFWLIVWRPTVDLEIKPQAIHHNVEHAYIVSLDGLAPPGYRLTGDDVGYSERSLVHVLQDGVAIGRPHSLHDEIRKIGEGRYSHWQLHLYFSTAKNSDPRVDGHRYTVNATATPGPLLAAVLYVTFAVTTLALVVILRRALLAARMQWVRTTMTTALATLAPHLCGIRGRVLVTLLICSAAATSIFAHWHEYYVTPDSRSYLFNQFLQPSISIRPPAVSVWLGLFADQSQILGRMDEIVHLGGANKPQPAGVNDPILPAIQAQRLFLLLAFLTLTFVATDRLSFAGAVLGLSATSVGIAYFSPDGVSAVLLVLGALAVLPLLIRVRRTNQGASFSKAQIITSYPSLAEQVVRVAIVVAVAYLFLPPILQHSFLSDQQQFLMSEALAMTWHLFFAASALWFIWRRNGIALVAAGAFAALAYLTRSASIFVLLLFGTLLLLALFYDRRRYIGLVIGSAVVTLVLVYAVPISWALRGEASVRTAPIVNWGPMAFAVEVAQPEDGRLLLDPTSKRFFLKMLSLRDDASSARETAPAYRSINLGANLYRVAIPAAREVLPDASVKNIDDLFGKVAQPILKQRSGEYLKIVGEAAAVALGLRHDAGVTRLFASPLHWLALIALLALAFWRVDRDFGVGTAAVLLVGMHVFHLIVVSAFDAPLSRYVFATEIFVVVAIVLIVDSQIRIVLKVGQDNWRAIGHHAVATGISDRAGAG